MSQWNKSLLVGMLGITFFWGPQAQAQGHPQEPLSDGKSCPGTHRILVTGGGGIRGAYQAGALWYLVNVMECDFQHFVGTSTGAVTAALLAQSANRDELKANVRMLVENYEQLKTSDDVVENRFLGRVRAVIPHWLGGTDGIHTLAPVIRKLARQVDFKRITDDRLTIPVVSLQSGKLTREKPESMLDRVVGSASIPLAVEPRRAIVWTEGYLNDIEGDRLRIDTRRKPGLGIGACKIRVKDEVFPCKHRAIRVLRDRIADPFVIETELTGVHWEVTLTVRGLPRTLRSELAAAIRPGHSPTLEFTTLHQLVDGGATDNIPLEDAYEIWALSEEKGLEFDSIFVLTTGSSATEEVASRELSGGMSIAARAFELLWEVYQGESLGIGSIRPVLTAYLIQAKQWIEAANRWRKTLESRLDATRLEELDRIADGRFVGKPPPLFDAQQMTYQEDKLFRFRLRDGTVPKMFVIDPQERVFGDSLKVEPLKIRQALHHGCELAADLFTRPGREPWGSLYSNPTLYLAEHDPACDRFTH